MDIAALHRLGNLAKTKQEALQESFSLRGSVSFSPVPKPKESPKCSNPLP